MFSISGENGPLLSLAEKILYYTICKKRNTLMYESYIIIQYGIVFGMATVAGGLFSPLCAKVGDR